MNDGLSSSGQLTEEAGTANVIKKELDDRLTEEHKRKKQVHNDYPAITVLNGLWATGRRGLLHGPAVK